MVLALVETKSKTQVFGILNLTPDSFSDGSTENLNLEFSLEKAKSLFAHGADAIDVGAESTRPGADTLACSEELSRLIPFLQAFRNSSDRAVSIDTRKAEIASAALNYEINYINDVSGLQGDPDLAKVIAPYDCQVIVMHSKGGIPAIPSKEVADDFYAEGDNSGLLEHMKEFFTHSIEIAEAAGIHKERLILDPGLGFGKNLKQSFEILNLIPEIKKAFGLPVLIGASRKSFLRAKLEEQEIEASTEALDKISAEYHIEAVQNGADIIRTHNVEAALARC